jgi:hypothetical protein
MDGMPSEGVAFKVRNIFRATKRESTATKSNTIDSTSLYALARDPTLTTGAYSTTCIQGKLALILVVMDPSEAIGIGPRACLENKISIEPLEQIPAAAVRSDAMQHISENI